MSSDPLWRALADPTRRRLIELLRDGPRTTGDLCRAFSTTRFAVMKHLHVLARAGVIVVHRVGRVRWNELNPEPLRTLKGRWPLQVPGLTPLEPVGLAPQHARVTVPRPPRQGARGLAVAIEQHVFIDAEPWRVFDALTVNIAAWWGAPHLRSPHASNLVLEPQPGGRFYEEWGHRQGALRGIVTAIRQDEQIEVTGSILDAATPPSSLRFLLERREGGTLLTVSYSGVALTPEHEDADRSALDDLTRIRLKAFVERGTRSGLAS